MSNSNPNQVGEAWHGLSLVDWLHDSGASGIIAVDGRRRITAFNPKAEALTRVKARRVLGQTFKELPAPLPGIILEVFSTRKPVDRWQVAFPQAKSEGVHLQISAAPLRAGKGGCSGVVVSLTNLTPSRELQQSLRHLDRLAGLGILSASMSHEIKNALVSVKTFVDLLLEKNRDAELAEVVSREMRRIDTMLSQMVKYAGPARTAFSMVRVHDVLDHSLRMVQPRLAAGLVSLHRAFNAGSDIIRGDNSQLEQAFLNLLLNAIEAMGPNGTLSVATDLICLLPARPEAAGTSTSGAQVRIAISDTGIGVTPENMKRLFEPFFTTKQQGTGLGLTITQRIVKEHNGDISVQSRVNQGTTFSITLPVHAPAH